MSGEQRKVWYAPHRLESYGEEEIEACNVCLRRGWLAGNGPTTKEFEEKVSSYFGKKFGLFVNSGSSANLLGVAALALKLPQGSEVVTPAQTFATTVSPLIQCGLKPVFCDVEYTTFVPSLEAIKAKITEKTSMLMLPNLLGSKPDWSSLRAMLKELGREDIVLFEDSCDTWTNTVDSDVATCSFYASHTITACGSGGIVMFNDKKTYEDAYCIMNWGRTALSDSENVDDRFNLSLGDITYDQKFLYKTLGYNFKSSEVNAAFGLVQFAKLPTLLKKRRENVRKYFDNLKEVKEITLPTDSEDFHWLAMPLMTDDRLGLLQYLEKNNVQTRVCFAGNITRHPPYQKWLEVFENSDKLMAKGFLLGAHHGMNVNDVDYVTDKIKEYFASKKN